MRYHGGSIIGTVDTVPIVQWHNCSLPVYMQMCPYLNIARGMGGWGSWARARSPPYHKHCQQQNVECSHDLSFNHIQNNAFLFSVKVLR